MANLGDLVVRIVGDNSDLDKSIDQSKGKLEKFGRDATRIGKSLTTFVTLPILGIGAAFVKAASDAEETNSKFNAVFKEQSDEVRSWAETFSDSVGRSTTANIGFLATIQDTLVPLGFMRDRAAEMSKATVELATDLASFNNLPTEQVVRDIQSAIVGNTETLRKYGVVASQEAIVQEALNAGLIETASELDATSKAQAIYNLLLAGTVDAQGDALRTADSTANQFRALKADVEDLAISFGQQLIPFVQDMVESARGLVSMFTELDEGTKRTIITIAALAASSGPIVLAVGAITKLRTAILALNTSVLFGPVGIIVGLAAVAAGLVMIGRKRRESQLEEIAEEFSDVKSAAGLAAEEIEAVEQALRLGSMDAFGDASEQVEALATNLGISEQAVIDIGLASDTVTQSYKDQLQVLKDQFTEQIALSNLMEDSWLANERERAAADARAAEMLRQREEAAAALAAQREAIQERADEAYASIERRLEEINRLEEFNLSIGEEYDADTERRKAILDEVNSLINDGIGLNTSYAGALEYIRTLYGDILTSTQAIDDEGDELVTKFGPDGKWLKGAKQSQEEFREELDETYGPDGKWRKGIKDTRTDLELFVEWYETNYIAKIADMTQGLFDAIADFSDARADAEIAAIERSTASEEEKDAKILAIKQRQARRNKALGVFNAVIDTAQAIVGFLAEPGGVAGIILSALAGVTGAAQVAAISAQPIPQLAQGGIVAPTTGGTQVNVGEAGTPEAVVPLDQLGSFLADYPGLASGGGDGMTQLTVNLDSQPILDTIFQATRDRRVLISQGAVV